MIKPENGKSRKGLTTNNFKILTVKNLSMSFGDLKAVDDVNFEVEKGEIFGIAGPNGAGKTTLFNLIAGALQGKGEIRFEKDNIYGLRQCKICQIGIARIFQIPSLFKTFNVFENVWTGARFGLKRKNNEIELTDEIRRIINFVELNGKEGEVVSSLDLFDKKKTMIASALATKPKILLLDEPVGGLSPKEVSLFISLIKKINEILNITIIVIEHRMRVITEICHRLMVLNNGSVLCIGPPNEVIQNNEVINVYLGEKYARSQGN